ncbi:MAG: hypothetical protein COB49_04310 [Alphaproteobacteria bacterium]|nr:MAG: hypothetical protein COB49_04310 [Alphaproteobacteria bacterium]
MRIFLAIVFFLIINMGHMQAVAADAGKNRLFGSWLYSCKSEYCFLSQSVATEADYKKTVLGITIGKQQGKLHILFRFTAYAVPGRGIGLILGPDQEWHLPITKCDKRICESGSFLDPVVLDAMKKNDKMTFTFHHNNGKYLAYPVSLMGLSDAVDLLVRTP